MVPSVVSAVSPTLDPLLLAVWLTQHVDSALKALALKFSYIPIAFYQKVMITLDFYIAAIMQMEKATTIYHV